MELSEIERLTLEAYADTVIPGSKRHQSDLAIAGVSDTPGAVEAGALAVLQEPAAGIADGVGEMAHLLNAAAAQKARENCWETDDEHSFASLNYSQRREVVTGLTARSNPQSDLWFILALFCYMAYDSSPHLDTSEALKHRVSGLRDMGFAPPVTAGRWVFEPFSYGRPLARRHPDTDEKGNLP